MMSEISVLWGKFDSFTGGCHTLHTHAAIDRTLTTILFSFPYETFSVLRGSYWKKLPAWVDGLCPVIYRYRESNLNCMRGLYPSAVHDHTSMCYFITIVKTSHSRQWMFWHFIRLFDWRTHVLIQIVSETEPGMAVVLHVTPAMPLKFRGDWSWNYFYGRSLFAADLCREIVIYWGNYVHSFRRAKHVQEQCG